MAAECFICGGTKFDQITPEYRHCLGCDHETLAQHQAQALMLNDLLDAEAIARDSALDRFQCAVLNRFARGRPRGQFVDIGSGSGKFLLRHGGGFAHAVGIEITPAAVNFSRNTLGLAIVGDIAAVEGQIDVATAWHSLEHFPVAPLTALLAALPDKIAPGGCIVVSVPNSQSFQYHWFRRHFAFFDVPSHLHQFSPQSLRMLFAAHGFVCTAEAVSWPYNIFGHVQALLNLVIRDHNYLYYRLKRGHPRGSLARDVATFGLLPIAVPLGLGLSLLDAIFPARQAVLTWRFENRA